MDLDTVSEICRPCLLPTHSDWIRNHTLLAVLFRSGLRISEVPALFPASEQSDLNPDAGALFESRGSNSRIDTSRDSGRETLSAAKHLLPGSYTSLRTHVLRDGRLVTETTYAIR
jgi:hypothetical protein